MFPLASHCSSHLNIWIFTFSPLFHNSILTTCEDDLEVSVNVDIPNHLIAVSTNEMNAIISLQSPFWFLLLQHGNKFDVLLVGVASDSYCRYNIVVYLDCIVTIKFFSYVAKAKWIWFFGLRLGGLLTMK